MKRMRSVSYETSIGAVRLRGQQVKHPRRELVVEARPARAQDRLVLAHDLGFDKEVRERRMRRVGGGRRKHDLGVTRDIERPTLAEALVMADSAQLDVILRRNGDFGVRVDLVIAAAEHRAPLRENRLRSVRSLERRLVGG